MIEGLSALTGPQRVHLASHKFSLPPGFPANMSSRWVEDGPEVVEAQQDEIIAAAGCKGEGWRVYKVVNREKTDAQNEKTILDFEAEQAALGSKADPKAKPKMGAPVRDAYTRVVGKRKYVLMMRPRELQTALNRIYSDISRTMVNQEIKGETAAVNESHDPGIITNADLRNVDRHAEPDPGAQYLAPSGALPTRLREAAEIPVG